MGRLRETLLLMNAIIQKNTKHAWYPSEGMGINQAALQLGAPCTTLKNQISEQVQHGCKPECHAYLSIDEERKCKSFLVTCIRIGYYKGDMIY